MSVQFMPARPGYSPPPFVRTNFPTVSTDYKLLPTDLGCRATEAGITITLPSIAQKLPGIYTVKNAAPNEIYTVPDGNDPLISTSQTSAAPENREVIEFDGARDFQTETTNNTWFTS